jgi:hypothetical protein
MAQRAQACLATTVVVGSALAGLLGLPFWAFLAAGSALSLISIWEQEKLRPRFAALGSTNMLTMAHLASVTDSCLVAASAWGVGLLFRFLLQSV